MIGAVFLLCLVGLTIMDMECRRIRKSIERTERRTKNLQRKLAVLHLLHFSVRIFIAVRHTCEISSDNVYSMLHGVLNNGG